MTNSTVGTIDFWKKETTFDSNIFSDLYIFCFVMTENVPFSKNQNERTNRDREIVCMHNEECILVSENQQTYL